MIVLDSLTFKMIFVVILHYFTILKIFFAAFSSILIRIYVKVSLKFFNDLDLNINDERKVIDIIMTQSRFFLARFWHEVNIDFFHEFFDKFDQYNLSYCFRNSSRKPEFGPYYPAAFDTTISVIRF